MMKPNFMEKLLDGVEVEWKPLGKVSNVLRGRRLTRSQLSDAEKFPVFHGGLEPLGYYGLSNRYRTSVYMLRKSKILFIIIKGPTLVTRLKHIAFWLT